jgi:hypothetical protein
VKGLDPHELELRLVAPWRDGLASRLDKAQRWTTLQLRPLSKLNLQNIFPTMSVPSADWTQKKSHGMIWR